LLAHDSDGRRIGRGSGPARDTVQRDRRSPRGGASRKDSLGKKRKHEELAKERAQTVRGALVAAGVPEARTTLAPPSSVTGGGNDREARRVEIRLKSS